MIQISQPLPADMPMCQPGHRIGTACAVATVPSSSRALTELRWRDHDAHIPLSQLRLARERAAVDLAA